MSLAMLGGMSQGAGSSLGGGTSGTDTTMTSATGVKNINVPGMPGSGGMTAWLVGGIAAAVLLVVLMDRRR